MRLRILRGPAGAFLEVFSALGGRGRRPVYRLSQKTSNFSLPNPIPVPDSRPAPS